MIKNIGLWAAVAAAGIGALPGTSTAADIPVKAPPQAVAQQVGNFYVWVDGSYRSVGLPTYDLGFKRLAPATFLNQGPAESYDPRAKGWGVAGAMGYVLPSGLRVELGGSYVDADVSQSGIGSVPGAGGTFLQLLNGTVVTSQGCAVPTVCATNSRLSSNFDAWSINLKASRDLTSGNFVLTPSGTLFGGRSRNNQTFAQHFSFAAVPVAFGIDYRANSSVRWSDIGAKAGLDVTLNLSREFSIGAGGTLGVAYRDASLSANDICTNAGGNGECLTNPASILSANANSTPFLANAEGRIIYRPTAAVALRGFTGVNFDSRVPGIATPAFSTTVIPSTAPPNNQGTPAGIKFSPETSWYAGGGIAVKFGP